MFKSDEGELTACGKGKKVSYLNNSEPGGMYMMFDLQGGISA
jgi:hypothetical protein